MRKIDALGLDLNLLIALHHLLQHRQVAAAASACGVTPSAMSRALTRLRAAFDDPLLCAVGRTLVPTSRALVVGPELAEILQRVQALNAPTLFDPATSDRVFRIACTDYEINVLLAPLVKRLRLVAPGLSFHLLNGGDLGVDSVQGDAELALLSPDGIYPWAKRRPLLREQFKTLVPKAALPLTQKRYLGLQHVLLATGEAVANPTDATFGMHQRKIACRARSFSSAIELACAGHWAFNAPQRFLKNMSLPDHMTVVQPTLAIPDFDVAMYWHPKEDKDPGLQWLRQRIVEVAGKVDRRSP